MMHKAIVQMDPMKLEMLDGFEQTDAGHKFTPNSSNIRAIVTGRDWSKKRILVYGSTSFREAHSHVNTIINRVKDVGHNAELIEEPKITNIAVNGDFRTPLQLEEIRDTFKKKNIEFEYEPEQFPAAIVKLEQPEATFLLFSTGRFGIQGLRSLDEIKPAISRIQAILFSDE
jgi:TATA-box binding protein (TBP) (component of TFIID and TFIIIB)